MAGRSASDAGRPVPRPAMSFRPRHRARRAVAGAEPLARFRAAGSWPLSDARRTGPAPRSEICSPARRRSPGRRCRHAGLDRSVRMTRPSGSILRISLSPISVVERARESSENGSKWQLRRCWRETLPPASTASDPASGSNKARRSRPPPAPRGTTPGSRPGPWRRALHENGHELVHRPAARSAGRNSEPRPSSARALPPPSARAAQTAAQTPVWTLLGRYGIPWDKFGVVNELPWQRDGYRRTKRSQDTVRLRFVLENGLTAIVERSPPSGTHRCGGSGPVGL